MTVIKYPLSTEKSVRLMESENKLVFVVEKHADKLQIKQDLEKLFKIKVTNVRTMVSPQGLKKAYVTLAKETPAIDVATKLGLL